MALAFSGVRFAFCRRSWRLAPSISGLALGLGLFLVALIFDLLARGGWRFGKFLVAGPLLGGVFLALAPITELATVNVHNAAGMLLFRLALGVLIGEGVGRGYRACRACRCSAGRPRTKMHLWREAGQLMTRASDPRADPSTRDRGATSTPIAVSTNKSIRELVERRDPRALVVQHPALAFRGGSAAGGQAASVRGGLRPGAGRDAAVTFIILGDTPRRRASCPDHADRRRTRSAARGQGVGLDRHGEQDLRRPGMARDEAIRSASLAAMTMMLVAQARGLASGALEWLRPTAVAARVRHRRAPRSGDVARGGLPRRNRGVSHATAGCVRGVGVRPVDGIDKQKLNSRTRPTTTVMNRVMRRLGGRYDYDAFRENAGARPLSHSDRLRDLAAHEGRGDLSRDAAAVRTSVEPAEDAASARGHDRQADLPGRLLSPEGGQIRAISKGLIEHHGGSVPDTIDALLELPGVGRKTANLVVTLGFDKPGICVDVHVHRITNRLLWVRTKRPDETEQVLRGVLPRRHWIPINEILVRHGQQVCKPISPVCSSCPVEPDCPRVGVQRSR